MRAELIDESLINSIYAGGVQRGDWTPALTRFRTLLNAMETCVADVILDRRTLRWSGRIVAATGCTYTDEVSEKYSRHYLQLDPKAPIFARCSEGFVFNDARHFDESFVARSPFYQEFSRTIDSRHTLDMLLQRDSGREIYLAAVRSTRQGIFTVADEQMIIRASGHFLRAWKLRQFVGEAQAAARTAAAALDSLGFGIAVLDQTGRVEIANIFARAAMTDGALRLDHGKLCATSGAVQRQLDAAISRAATGRGGAHAIRIPRGEHRYWFLWCMPLSPTNPLAAKALPGILIVIRDPAVRIEISIRDLMILYGMTQSEAEVAQALADGQTLSAIAGRRGVKPSTVHTQLHRILQKTGLHRQSDLVRAIVSLSRPRGRTDIHRGI
jgi:DNA-binding NarL/FixJ family response regulator